MPARIGHVVLHRQEGSPVTVEVDRTLDRASVPADPGPNLAERATVPAGIYTEAAFYMPIQSATLTDGGSPRSLPAANPLSVDLEILDSYLSVDTEFRTRLTLKLILRNDRGNLSFSTGLSYG